MHPSREKCISPDEAEVQMLQTWEMNHHAPDQISTNPYIPQEIKEFARKNPDPTNRPVLRIRSVIWDPFLPFSPFLTFPDRFIRLHS